RSYLWAAVNSMVANWLLWEANGESRRRWRLRQARADRAELPEIACRRPIDGHLTVRGVWVSKKSGETSLKIQPRGMRNKIESSIASARFHPPRTCTKLKHQSTTTVLQAVRANARVPPINTAPPDVSGSSLARAISLNPASGLSA